MSVSSDTFVPLSAGSPSKAGQEEFRVLVAQSPEKARPLREFTPPSVGVAGEAKKCEPRVALQREGENIVGIQIQCSCGQIIDLKCAYSDELAPAPA